MAKPKVFFSSRSRDGFLLMKNQSLLCIALFAFLGFVKISDASAQFGGLFGGPKVESIETVDLAELLQDQQQAEAIAKESGEKTPAPSFLVVDVRSDAEVNVSVIPGAITKAQYEKDRKQYDGRTIIPYCTVGGRSGAYAKKLAADGVKVKNYEGSILKWVDAGLPLVTLDGAPTNRVHTYSDRYKIPAKYEQVTE
jgi:rhodanese-related sulfurtransferase